MKKSKIIVPPDDPIYLGHGILLIDPFVEEIKYITEFMDTVEKTINLYVYLAHMGDLEWLSSVLNKVDTTIINTSETEILRLKYRLVNTSNAWYYGPGEFVRKNRRLPKALDYFQNAFSSL